MMSDESTGGSLEFAVAIMECERLRDAIIAINQHWIEGISEDSERDKPWHRKMRALLDQALKGGER